MTHYQYSFPYLFVHCNQQTRRFDVTEHSLARLANMAKEWVEWVK